jgi:hypothetical protein
MIAELRSWLPNYDHGPADYPTLVWRILASLPYGDEAADMGYEPFNLGWQEADQLGRMLTAIEGKDDVEDLIRGLLADEDEGEFEVVVGNIGTVYRGTEGPEARATFKEYKEQSKSGTGRAAGESVTLFQNGEPIDEWAGENLEEARRHRSMAQRRR